MNERTFTRQLIRARPASASSQALENGSRVAVMGGGPAGSLFSYFLLTMAERNGVEIRVDIYEPCDFSFRTIETHNHFGRVIFAVTHMIQRIRFSRRAVLSMASREQQKQDCTPRMSSVLWDTFTGSAPYQDIFLRTLHPAFWGNLTWDMATALIDG
jgi:hypothetical protein